MERELLTAVKKFESKLKGEDVKELRELLRELRKALATPGDREVIRAAPVPTGQLPGKTKEFAEK